MDLNYGNLQTNHGFFEQRSETRLNVLEEAMHSDRIKLHGHDQYIGFLNACMNNLGKIEQNQEHRDEISRWLAVMMPYTEGYRCGKNRYTTTAIQFAVDDSHALEIAKKYIDNETALSLYQGEELNPLALALRYGFKGTSAYLLGLVTDEHKPVLLGETLRQAILYCEKIEPDDKRISSMNTLLDTVCQIRQKEIEVLSLDHDTWQGGLPHLVIEYASTHQATLDP